MVSNIFINLEIEDSNGLVLLIDDKFEKEEEKVIKFV